MSNKINSKPAWTTNYCSVLIATSLIGGECTSTTIKGRSMDPTPHTLTKLTF